MLRVDDALQFLVNYLRGERLPRERAYGYDLYIPYVCKAYAQDVENISGQDYSKIEQRVSPLSSVFYEAAWELCRRGVLRPGVRSHREQATEDGSGGNGYSLTSVGRTWIADSAHAVLMPIEPARVAELIARFRDRFGEGFFQRSQEAIKCHYATAYLASCVMCGAAAESILLSLAVKKVGNEEEVLKVYKSTSGRKKVEDLLLEGVGSSRANTFRTLSDLLKYWRDDASHGKASDISEFEAYEAFARLLRFAHFASDHVNEFIKSKVQVGD